MSSYRDLELLVSRIESALAPAGAIVKSPDRIPEIVSGNLREVDVSIRYQVGSVPLLITVECRDRVSTEDVTWIEQLATKRSRIGAAHTIAVSSTGFSAPAIEAAKEYGILIRTITELTDADILEWIDSLQIEEATTAFHLGKLHLTYASGSGAPIAPTMEREWMERSFDARIFFERATGLHISLVELISKAVPKNRRLSAAPGSSVSIELAPQSSVSISNDPLDVLTRGLPTDGTSVERMCWIDFPEGALAMETTVGFRDLVRVGFEAKMSATHRPVPASRLVSYSDNDKVNVDVAEHRIGEHIVVTRHRLIGESDT